MSVKAIRDGITSALTRTSEGMAWEADGRSSRLAIRDSADWIAASIASFDSASLTV